ncbi:MAG: glycoside hydrolase family 9 protein [Spirochaetales bacterium]|nr:glycoside hydrolase family 9 protein [Spirochaetales bacterium]
MVNKKFLIVITLALLVTLTSYAQMSQAVGFFAYNICGSGQTVSWRGNCHMGDNPTGGYHDAGDHVKFNLPMSFTASFMCWADYEYGASVDTPVSRILSYLNACGTSPHKYQVGNAGTDHAYWGPPENQTGDRPTYSSSQVSCVQAGTAAAFAIAAAAGVSGGNVNTAKSFLSAAESSMSDSGYTQANGFYDSYSGFYDELAWASLWIYLAGGGDNYLQKAESYVSQMKTDWKWTHCWDDKGYGVYLKLAQITQKAEYIEPFEAWLDWWMPNGGINHTNAGFPWLDSWGCLRYASATAFLAKLWSDSQVCTPTKVSGYRKLASDILSYIRGNNPRGGSYIIGYGSNWPKNPHHRAACPSKTNGGCSYTLTGALVGGPNQSDSYQDDLNQYQFTEVALDYNACLVAAIAAENGSPPTYAPTPAPTPTPSPGPTALPGTGNGLKGSYYSGTNFGTLVMTRTDARIDFNWGGGAPENSGLSSDGWSVRWEGELEPVYTDTYTLYENSDDGCRVFINNQAVIDEWNDGAAEEKSGTISLNAGQRYPFRVEFFENGGDASITVSWSSAYQEKEIIPQSRLYSDSPDPTPDPTPVVTNPPAVTDPPQNLGDVNGDGTIDIVDALLIAQYYVGLTTIDTTNADTNCDGNVDIIDALLIAQYYVNLISQFC